MKKSSGQNRPGETYRVRHGVFQFHNYLLLALQLLALLILGVPGELRRFPFQELALSYSASYLFYLIVVLLPSWRNRRYSRRIARRRIRRLLAFAGHVEDKLKRLTGMENLEACSQLVDSLPEAESSLNDDDAFAAERDYMKSLIGEIFSMAEYMDLRFLDSLDELDSAVADLYFLYEEPDRSFSETHGPKIRRFCEAARAVRKLASR